MASDFSSLGPIHHFVRFRGSGSVTALYLGTAEVTPVVNAQPVKLRVQNDVAGRSVGMQDVDDGERHEVTTVLNRFDYTTWKICRDRVNHNSSIAGHGVDGPKVRGSLIRGFYDFQLVLIYEFTGIAPFHPQSRVDQPAGRLYYAARCDNWGEDPSATRVMAMPLLFGCESLFDPSTRSFGLYTEDPANFGTLAPIT